MTDLKMHSGQAAFAKRAGALAEKIDDLLDGHSSAEAVVAMAILLTTSLEREGDYPRPQLLQELKTLIAAMVHVAPRTH